jgi:RimJ/RimL family protein N-acetyltransferase
MAPNNPGRGFDFEIHLRPDPTAGHPGKLIGIGYLADIDAANRHARIGITLGDRTEWGKGYGREVMDLLLRFGYDHLDLHRIDASAFAYNTPWKRLLDAAGFREEGCLRDYLHRDGRYWDKTTYALLAPEHYARKTLAA